MKLLTLNVYRVSTSHQDWSWIQIYYWYESWKFGWFHRLRNYLTPTTILYLYKSDLTKNGWELPSSRLFIWSRGRRFTFHSWAYFCRYTIHDKCTDAKRYLVHTFAARTCQGLETSLFSLCYIRKELYTKILNHVQPLRRTDSRIGLSLYTHVLVIPWRRKTLISSLFQL